MTKAVKGKRIIDDNFEKLEKIGHGSYGTVYKVLDKRTSNIVAIKRVKLNTEPRQGISSSSLREIASLKSLKHANIIELFEVIHTDSHLYLIFEHMDQDLKQHLENSPDGIPMHVAKSYLWQLLKAISYCHSRRIVHRDLKLQNILINSEGLIKLADFGLSRIICLPLRTYTTEIVTLWYRAPEILLRSDHYGPSIDIWSLGCIHFEILTKRVLFKGDSEIEQLFKIFRVLGTPANATWPNCEQLGLFNKASFPKWNAIDIKALSPDKIDQSTADMLYKFFVFDPMSRISASRAMSLKYFEGIRSRLTLRCLPTAN